MHVSGGSVLEADCFSLPSTPSTGYKDCRLCFKGKNQAVLFVAALLIAPVACVGTEGSDPGECSDGADNDMDGNYDCADSDCEGSPDCAGEEEYISGGELTRSFAATGALVDYNNRAFCTASLVGADLVLTAAHCVEGVGGGAIRFVLGADLGTSAYSSTVSGVHIHPFWNGNAQFGNDLAVLDLAEPITDVAPVNLHLGDISTHVGQTMTLVGYGRQWSDQVTGIRRLARVVIASVDAETIIYEFNGSGACHGDSGGPAFLQVDGTWRQIGVTSWGDDSCLSTAHYQRLDVHSGFLRDMGAPSERTPLDCDADGCDGQCEEDEDCWELMCPTGSCTAPSGVCISDGTCDADCGTSDPDCASASMDYCQIYGLYGNGVCNTGCLSPDPDCAACTPIMWNYMNGLCYYMDYAGRVCWSGYPFCTYYGCSC